MLNKRKMPMQEAGKDDLVDTLIAISVLAKCYARELVALREKGGNGNGKPRYAC